MPSDGNPPDTELDVANTGAQPSGTSAAPAGIKYQLGELLGQGGMGEVVLARDRAIGRSVALKRMRAAQPSEELLQRFLREARIQARLDHPAIVPVYEIGEDADGRPYFTMRRLAGTTLAGLLEAGTESQQRLLRGMVDVSLAVEFAHSHGVIHRDLKPSNIMLGSYGEVYVLDWGVARLVGDPQVQTSGESFDDIESLQGETRAGSLLGTPGYMAPEQALGERVGTHADVYALGSILFEILAGEPLHPRASALSHTLSFHDRSPARRRPDRNIPPELDAVCVAALDAEPERRPTAGALADQIQRYLDGDRDVERRRTHAAELVTSARAALERGDRAEAMRVAGQAMIFDATSTDAADMVRSLIVEPPRELPTELQELLRATAAQRARERSRRGILAYLAFFMLTPMLPFLDIISWTPVIALNLGLLWVVAMLWLNATYGVPPAIQLLSHLVMVVLFSRMSGPFVLTPILICAVILSATSTPYLIDRRWAVVGWTVISATAPFLLEYIGVLSPSWLILPEGVISRGTMFHPSDPLSILILFVGNVTAVVVVALFALHIARDRRQAERQQQIHTWHLEQILPRRPSQAS